jgi:hypothetical protein
MKIEILDKTDECIFAVKDNDKSYEVKIWMNLNNGKPVNTIVRDNSTGEMVSEELEDTIVTEVLRNWLRLVA